MVCQVVPIKVEKGSFKNYCYMIFHSKSKAAVLVDPAWQIEEIKQLLNTYEARLKGILLTHHHPDHIDLADYFATYYHVPVYISKAERQYYKFKCSNLIEIDIKNYMPLTIGSIEICVIFTPGHTYGSLCYWLKECDALLTGDTLFIEGCGMCRGLGADPLSMYNSICKLKLLPLNTKIYPGHSYGEDPGKELIYLYEKNIYFHLSNYKSFYDFRMRKMHRSLLAFQ